MLSKLTARESGPISWMIHNRVTPNLLMLFLILGGIFMTTRIKQEVFPEFEMDRVDIIVSYPGSSPEEVEKGIVLAIEDAIEGIEGVKEIMLPGDPERRIMAERTAQGIPLDDGNWAALVKLAGELGVAAPDVA